MATVAKTTLTGITGDVTVTETTLTATNTFVYTRGGKQTLVLRNSTGAPIECVIDGDGGGTVPVPGIGGVDVSGGFSITVAAGAVEAVLLDSIFRYLSGTIAMTGEGLTAYILE
jgi:hypothetical protein